MVRPRGTRGTLANHINEDVSEFPENVDSFAPPVGLDMAGHDTHLMGPKIVILDSFVVDLLNVDTSAQTFRLKLLLNMDWEDDGTIEPEVKAKRNLGRPVRSGSDRSINSADGSERSSFNRSVANSTYKTGKYVLKKEFRDDPLGTTWNPEVVLVNAIADEDPIEAGSKFHSVEMLSGRPIVSRSVLYQPECRCKFSFSNFPFDETDLVVKFSSNKWNSERVNFIWSNRLGSMGRDARGNRISHLGGAGRPGGPLRRESSFVRRTVDPTAIGGLGVSEFEIIKVRVETDEKDVNSMQRYDNTEGAFSQAHLVIRVRRDPLSYLMRVASVALLLMILEVLSFLTDHDGLADRFSISGTIFLAMVSLYGPMADALPKVSVITRVDRWHMGNFILLFVSNVENLAAFMLRDIVNKTVMTYSEFFLGVAYLYLVVLNARWFVEPIYERKEYARYQMILEDKVDDIREYLERTAGKLLLQRRRGRPGGGSGMRQCAVPGLGAGAHSPTRTQNGPKKSKGY